MYRIMLALAENMQDVFFCCLQIVFRAGINAIFCMALCFCQTVLFVVLWFLLKIIRNELSANIVVNFVFVALFLSKYLPE